MALIKCVECEKEFSDKADFCPNCGCPKKIKKETKKEKKIKEPKNKKSGSKKKIIIIVVIVLLLIGVGVGGYLFLGNKRTTYKGKKLTTKQLEKYLDMTFKEVSSKNPAKYRIKIEPKKNYYQCNNLKLDFVIEKTKYNNADEEVSKKDVFTKEIKVNDDCTANVVIKVKSGAEIRYDEDKNELYLYEIRHAGGSIGKSDKKYSKYLENIENQIYENVSDIIIHNYEKTDDLKINKVKYENFNGNSGLTKGEYKDDDVQGFIVEITGKRSGYDTATHCEYIYYSYVNNSWGTNFYENCRYTPTENNNYNNDYVFDKFYNKKWGTLLEDDSVDRLNKKLEKETFDTSRYTKFLAPIDRFKKVLKESGYVESGNTYHYSYGTNGTFYKEVNLDKKEYYDFVDYNGGQMLYTYKYGENKITYVFKYVGQWVTINWDLDSGNYRWESSLSNYSEASIKKTVEEDMTKVKDDFFGYLNKAGVSLDDIK